MDARQVLEQLYRHFGVSTTFGERFLPLIERAVKAEPDVRERLIELISTSFAKESQRRMEAGQAESRADEAVLRVVANVLHHWEPPDWALNWKQNQQPPAA